MYKKQDVLDKLNSLLFYSIEQEPEFEGQYTELIKPVITTVNTYFSSYHPQLEERLKELVHNMYCDILERNTVMEFTYGDELPTNYPESYHDITKCFYQFPLMGISNETFHAAWIMGIVNESEEEPIDHTMIKEWASEINAAIQTDFNNVQALLTWVQNSCNTNYLVNLLEDTGRLIHQPWTQEIATDIYITKKLLEVIKALGLRVYIPSYLR